MNRLLRTIGASFVMLALATPVAAQEQGDTCEDPAADPSTFICGQITVTLAEGTEDSINDVIERVAPDADISIFLEPEAPGMTYGLNVGVGEEWDLVTAFRADEAVEVAHVVQTGQLTDPTPAPTPLPNTATPIGSTGSVASVIGLVMVLGITCAALAVARTRAR